MVLLEKVKMGIGYWDRGRRGMFVLLPIWRSHLS